MVLATPAMTPALAPEADDFFSLDRSSGGMLSPRANNGQSTSFGAGLQPIPGSPMQPTSTTEGTVSKPTSPSEQPSGGGRDYFSLRGDRSRTTSGRRAATTTGAESSTTSTAVDETPFSPGGGDPPATPGGTFMGKFKGFGKGKKAPTGGVSTPAPVVEVSEEETQRLADEAKVSLLRLPCYLDARLTLVSRSLPFSSVRFPPSSRPLPTTSPLQPPHPTSQTSLLNRRSSPPYLLRSSNLRGRGIKRRRSLGGHLSRSNVVDGGGR